MINFSVNRFEEDVNDWGRVAGKYYVWCNHSDAEEMDDGLEINNLYSLVGMNDAFSLYFSQCNGVVVSDKLIPEYLFNTKKDAVKFAGISKKLFESIRLSKHEFDDFVTSIVLQN